MDKERILLADDDYHFREGLKGLLEDAGHVVVAEAVNLRQVQAAVDDPDLEFRVAIIDNEMPDDGDGAEAAAYVREQRPEVIIISLAGRAQVFGDYNLSKKQRPIDWVRTIYNV